MPAKLSSALVSTDWLAQYLGDSDLRIYDCTEFIAYDADEGISVRAGRPEYEEAHIPGAAFVDLFRDLSDPAPDVPYLMMPSPEVFSRVLSAAGLGDEHRVVLYSSDSVMWATRLWWMLRASGFTNAAVLNGGLQKWKDEGRAVARGKESYPAASFTARPDAARWVDKETVLAEIGSDVVCTINALSEEAHLGTGEQMPFEQAAYGRQGRIKGSRNVYYGGLQTEGLFAPVDQLRHAFEEAGTLGQERIICYCGAGLGATVNALALHLIGYDNVAVYDGGLNEWGWDSSLPMETG